MIRNFVVTPEMSQPSTRRRSRNQRRQLPDLPDATLSNLSYGDGVQHGSLNSSRTFEAMLPVSGQKQFPADFFRSPLTPLRCYKLQAPAQTQQPQKRQSKGKLPNQSRLTARQIRVEQQPARPEWESQEFAHMFGMIDRDGPKNKPTIHVAHLIMSDSKDPYNECKRNTFDLAAMTPISSGHLISKISNKIPHGSFLQSFR